MSLHKKLLEKYGTEVLLPPPLEQEEEVKIPNNSLDLDLEDFEDTSEENDDKFIMFDEKTHDPFKGRNEVPMRQKILEVPNDPERDIATMPPKSANLDVLVTLCEEYCRLATK